MLRKRGISSGFSKRKIHLIYLVVWLAVTDPFQNFSSSKRISSSSDHSMDSVFNDLNNGTPRSTLDLSRFEHSFQSPSSLSSYTGDGHSRHVSAVSAVSTRLFFPFFVHF